MHIWEAGGGGNGYGFRFFATKEEAQAHIKQMVEDGCLEDNTWLSAIEVAPTGEGIAQALNDLACDCQVGGDKYFEELKAGDYGR